MDSITEIKEKLNAIYKEYKDNICGRSGTQVCR